MSRYMSVSSLSSGSLGCCALGSDHGGILDVLAGVAGKGAYWNYDADRVWQILDSTTQGFQARSSKQRPARSRQPANAVLQMVAQLIPAAGTVSVFRGRHDKDGTFSTIQSSPTRVGNTGGQWQRVVNTSQQAINTAHDAGQSWSSMVAIFVPRGFRIRTGYTIARRSDNSPRWTSSWLEGPRWSIQPSYFEEGGGLTGNRGVSRQWIRVEDRRTKEQRDADDLARQAGGLEEVGAGAEAVESAAAAIAAPSEAAQQGMQRYEAWQQETASQAARVDAHTETQRQLAEAIAQQQAQQQWADHQRQQQGGLPGWVMPVGIGTAAVTTLAIVVSALRR